MLKISRKLCLKIFGVKKYKKSVLKQISVKKILLLKNNLPSYFCRMKIFVSIIAWVGAQQQPTLPPIVTTPATTTTILPPTISAADRCKNNNGKNVNFYNQDGPKESRQSSKMTNV